VDASVSVGVTYYYLLVCDVGDADAQVPQFSNIAGASACNPPIRGPMDVALGNRGLGVSETGDNRICHFLPFGLCSQKRSNMNVSLTPELEKFVETEVGSGLYQTASEVVRAGLRRLKEDRQARLRQIPATLEELETRLLESIEALESGKGVRGEDVFRRLRKRIKETRGKS
jgi:antitoxin ParD1/3/4